MNLFLEFSEAKNKTFYASLLIENNNYSYVIPERIADKTEAYIYAVAFAVKVIIQNNIQCKIVLDNTEVYKMLNGIDWNDIYSLLIERIWQAVYSFYYTKPLIEYNFILKRNEVRLMKFRKIRFGLDNFLYDGYAERNEKYRDEKELAELTF